MGRTVGVSGLMRRRFDVFSDLSPIWIEAIGPISRPFTWLIYGHPKQGKTSFALQFCREMSRHAKVYYNTIEQGISQTFQNQVMQVGLESFKPGKFMIGDRDNFEEMFEKIKAIHAQVVVIDSRDYMKLTIEQWKKLTSIYKRKSFVLICWEQAGKPAGKYARDIAYLVDMVTRVHDFRAVTNGRFGADLRYRIWDKKPHNGEQIALTLENGVTHEG